ncbi:alpha/beta fold hydrolase [Ketobacter sp. MCCC 1A13808]|uniref:alpha/beta hydrolase n=1 Tax=Ketobacter sp. MCCC 1A13808 TaxID=2602738 RepID=UPI000F22193C|nr:alpha/beta fold hydrolase [Ketobacter sp. MCCC 1A13808]MVF10812.1 alpha/beta fold hydrolase [Ketobacter sp. MCCC 1A13808]RLP56216.1 MAG: alpha/beta fold hydrolase [Ketobacter sp.]
MPKTSQTLLEYEIIEPGREATACVIWLHGLGASGHDFIPVVPHLPLADDLSVRFIFPHAPSIPVSCNSGYVMPAWYDILALTEVREINQSHLEDSRMAVSLLIEQQIEQGIPCEKILLIGFSQGGAVVYHTGLQYPQKLAGLIALSTYMPNPQLLDDTARTTNQNITIHIAQGTADDMVKEPVAYLAYEWLQQHEYKVDWTTYPMGHEVCMPEIRQIGTWITELLKD